MKRCPECRRDYFDETLLYCLDDGAHLVEGPASELPSESPTRVFPTADTKPDVAASKRNSVIAGIVGIVVVAALGVGGYLYYGRAPSKQIDSIAVMPFSNEGGNTDLEFLSDGLTETLIGNLSRLPGVSVKARSSVSRYKGKDLDLKGIGSALSADALLTGRLVDRGERVAVYVEFIEPSTESVLWKADYLRSKQDIAALQSEIARDVANRLKAKLSGAETIRLAKYHSTNSEAYELYLKGEYFSNRGAKVETLAKAIEHFEGAIRLDPAYTLAYVGLARSYMNLGSVFGLKSPQETFPKAKEALIRAVDMEGDLAEAHGALGEYYLRYEWNWPAAERELTRAIEIDPDNPSYHSELGAYYQSIGRFEDAIRARDTSRRLDPVVPFRVADVGYPCYYARQQDRAIEWYKRALSLDPGFAWAYLWTGQSYLELNKLPEAIAEIERAVDLSQRNVRAVATLGHAYAKAGRSEAARKILKELQDRSKTEYVSPYFFAVLYAGMGDTDLAFQHLEKARMERQSYLFLLNVEPVFDALRSDPRFSGLVKMIGIPGS